MIRALALALVLTGVGDAPRSIIRGNSTLLGRVIGGTSVPTTPLMLLPMKATGGLIPEDSSTVAHVYWNGAALVDSKANSWTQNGTVPQNVASPLFPNGFNISTPGAGPFSAANYYSLGTGSDVLDFAGDFSACFLYREDGLAHSWFSNGADGVDGWRFFNSNAFGYGATLVQTAGAGAGTIALTCVGRGGSTLFAKTNLGAIVTAAAPVHTVGSTTPARIGVDGSASGPSLVPIFEAYFTTTTASDVLFTAIQTAFYLNPGAPIIEDANTVSHVRWNGTALVDSKANSWTQNGTVPQTTSGFVPPSKRGAGPYSAVNNYTLASPNPLQFTGDFTVCGVLLGSPAASQHIFGVDQCVSSGWVVYAPTQNAALYSRATGIAAVTGNTFIAGAANVFCAGRAAGTSYVKLNLGTTATTVTNYTVAPATPARLGVDCGGIIGLDAKLVEMWASTTPWNEANVTQIQQRVFGMLGTRGEAITVTRANPTTGATFTTPDGSIWFAAPNILRIGCEDSAAAKCGALIEPSITNVGLQSEALATLPWQKNVGITITADQGTLPGYATATMDQLAGAVGTVDSVFQTVTVASTAGPFTTSAWLASTTGTVTASIGGFCPAANNATGVTCVRSDGGACTTGTATVNAFGYGTVGTTPVRFLLTFSCTAATTAPGIFISPGQFNTNTNATIVAGGAQFEVNAFATSYIPTTTVAVLRDADLVSAANPLVPTNPAKWCLEETYTPENSRAWDPGSSNLRLMTAGNPVGTPNTAYVSAQFFGVYDGAGSQKFIGSYTPPAAGARRLSGEDANGNLRLLIDGVDQGAAGGSTGIMSAQPSTLYPGNDGGVAAVPGGYVRDFKAWNRTCP